VIARRPEYFTINPTAPLAKNLVFAGLCALPRTVDFHDSSLAQIDATFTSGMDPHADTVWAPEIGRLAIDFEPYYNTSTDYIQLGSDPPALDFVTGDAFTMSCWCYQAGDAAAGSSLFAKYDSAGYQYQLRLWSSNWNFLASNGSVVGPSEIIGEWIHVAITVDAAGAGFFWINGEPSNQFTGRTFTNRANNPTLGIGDQDVTWHVWYGKIADPLIHRRVLSQNEIQSLAEPSNVMLSGLIRLPHRRVFAAPSSTSGTTIDCTSPSVTATSYQASISTGTIIDCASPSVTATSYQASISAGTTIDCTSPSVTATSYQASVSTGTTIDCTSPSVTATSYQASISAGTIIDCTSPSVTATSYQASVSAGTTIDCTSPSVTATSYQATVSTSEASVHKQILDYVETTIEGLGLTDIDTVYARKFTWRQHINDLSLPCCIIAPARENLALATNKSYDMAYGIQVVLIQVCNRDYTANLDRLMKWREDVIREFQGRSFTASDTFVWDVKIEPGPVVDQGVFLNQYDATSFVMRCYVREPKATSP
jgi:hypothetical protein